MTSRFYTFLPARRLACALLLTGSAALLSACQSDGVPPSPLTELANYSSGKPAEQAKAEAKPEPMTRSRAAMECWAKADKAGSDVNLDKRADIVTKCIDDKLKTVKADTKG
jgi:hypothetical protein